MLEIVIVRCDDSAKDSSTPPHAEKTRIIARIKGCLSIVPDPTQIRLASFCMDRPGFLKAAGIDDPALFTPERFERGAECGKVVEENALEDLSILIAGASFIAFLFQDSSTSKSSPGRQLAGAKSA